MGFYKNTNSGVCNISPPEELAKRIWGHIDEDMKDHIELIVTSCKINIYIKTALVIEKEVLGTYLMNLKEYIGIRVIPDCTDRVLDTDPQVRLINNLAVGFFKTEYHSLYIDIYF